MCLQQVGIHNMRILYPSLLTTLVQEEEKKKKIAPNFKTQQNVINFCIYVVYFTDLTDWIEARLEGLGGARSLLRFLRYWKRHIFPHAIIQNSRISTGHPTSKWDYNVENCFIPYWHKICNLSRLICFKWFLNEKHIFI